MANVKITDLTAYTDPKSTDVLPIVDVTNDITKKVDIAGILKNAPAGSASATAFAFDGDPNTGIYSPGADTLAASTGGSERLRIDSSGRLLVGTSSYRSFQWWTYLKHQIEGTGETGGSLSLFTNSSDIYPSVLVLGKSRGTTLGSVTAVNSGDGLGEITFFGADGTASLRAAAISALVDGTPGTNDMPGRLVFSTTADGASSPTERMRIKSTGAIRYVTAFTVATLPAGEVGDLARVTDASSPTIGNTVAGGGAAAALCWYNGSNWTVIGK